MSKYLKISFLAILSFFVILPMITNAKSIINNNGIEISESDYENFLGVFDDTYIMNMSVEKYNRIKELDFSNKTVITKYIISTYDPHLNIKTEREVTEKEYDNYNKEEPLRVNTGSVSTETTAKRLVMSIISGSTWDYVNVTATWKYMPTVRSFDVIGIRTDGLSVRNGSQQGEQSYYTGSWGTVNYSWNGTNIKKFSNGFGISMNLVNNTNISFLQLSIDCDVQQTATHGQLFGSYQHAVSNLSLASSQNYTLGGAGLGGVFVYPYNISQKYDGMTGLVITF